MNDHSEPLGAILPEEAPAPLLDPPGFRLFTPDQVGGATFFGGALAGGVLLWLNSRKLKDGKTFRNLTVSLLVTAVTLGSAFTLPDNFPGVAIGAVALVIMRAYAQMVQGQALAEHVRRGGARGSTGRAVLISLLSCALILGAIFGVFYATLPPGFHLGKDEVVYRSGAQESEARMLAESLKKMGFFQDRGVSVFLSKPDGSYHVGIVVKDGAWDSGETCDAFRPLGPELSKNTFQAAPVVMELVNGEGEVKKSL